MPEPRTAGLVPRDVRLALPTSTDALLNRLAGLLELSDVEEIAIRTNGIKVRRWVPEATANDAVLPEWTPPELYSADALFDRVLDSLEELPAEKWNQHPHLLILEATRRLERRGMVPVAILTAHGPHMASWLGSEQDIGSFFLGCRVIRGDPERFSQKLAVLGAPEPQGRLPRLDDISGAVLIDMGEW